ncbi:hypothetical protein AX15_006871 [Amanita polypyramis BW_CC]|nr:hypothetical protein AX15_006871 [Amanita polypyramis BW_CC]
MAEICAVVTPLRSIVWLFCSNVSAKQRAYAEQPMARPRMPPGPAYNWLCVVYSAVNILSHAAQYRVAQVAQRPSTKATVANLRSRQAEEESDEEWRKAVWQYAAPEHIPDIVETSNSVSPGVDYASTTNSLERDLMPSSKAPSETVVVPLVTAEGSGSDISAQPVIHCLQHNGVTLEEQLPTGSAAPNDTVQTYATPSRNLQSSKVPSSRIGRLFHYGGLAASLGYGAASEMLRRTSGNSNSQSSVIMTEANIKRLVAKLSQMRGAALKLGQFMSIQETHVLGPEIDRIFRRVQDSAHYMPDWQMEKVMLTSLGSNWMSNFASFDRIPFAAASIGQVHRAVLSPSVSPTGREEPVAIKVQFPNIRDSITSDLGYIKLLLTASKLFPKGLFLDKTIKVMSEELADECNYMREASFLRKFGSMDRLGGDPRFKIPWVWEGSTRDVLVMERVNGFSVGEADASHLSQQDRNDIASWIIELCLKELFEYRTMQTDPNWSNFLWNPSTRQIELVDFGASREYSQEFMDNWLHLLQAAASQDRDACIQWSLKLGYLTGEENEIMLNAHVDSMVLLATPFRESTPQPFAFGPGGIWADITASIRAQIPVMLKHRLTPPPKETYSLNRKLSGAFLLASRLGATVQTKTIWDKVVSQCCFGAS